ncbi:MAG TPA: hypothetical protein VGO92_14290 [Acidimicrobiales bacterium]|jgi:hypothetical protein|nr:hypothetical protein [Acidimicrobiales bacterium]
MPRLRALHPALWWAAYGLGVLGAAVVVIGPSHVAFDGAFMAWRPPLPSAATSPGDHLQTSYFLWLWEDGLRHGRLPWRDVYQFAATGHGVHQPFGWPLALLAVPVSLVAGPVAAYNTLVLAAFVLAAAATAGLVRALGLSRSAAAVAGVAFAFAPYRLVQATSHVNALLAFLLPLLLLCIEKALQGGRRQQLWGWGAAAAMASIAGSGEGHLAVFAAGLAAVYLLGRWRAVRGQARRLAGPAAAFVIGAAGAGLALQHFVLGPSAAAGGRSVEEASEAAPRLANLASRTHPYAWPLFERYAYPGLVIAALALAGLVLWARRRPALVATLAALIAGALVLAVGPSLEDHPGFQRAYRVIPFLAYSRVPGRILIVSALALAVAAALAVEQVRRAGLRAALALAAAGAMLVDAPSGLFAANPVARHALPGVERGDRVLDLPAFDPGHFTGAVYAFDLIDAPGPRVGGYSPFVTPAAGQAQAVTAPLSSPPVDPCRWKEAAQRFAIERVAVHRSLYGPGRLQWAADPEVLIAELAATPGFTRAGAKGDVVVFSVDPARIPCGG